MQHPWPVCNHHVRCHLPTHLQDGSVMVVMSAFLLGRLCDAAMKLVNELLPSGTGGNLSSLCSWASSEECEYGSGRSDLLLQQRLPCLGSCLELEEWMHAQVDPCSPTPTSSISSLMPSLNDSMLRW